MKLKVAAAVVVLALAGLAACGPTGTATGPQMAPASHAPCADADASTGDPDGDCR